MSTKKFLINSLAACDKSEFDRVVKSYLKEVHNHSRIVNTDGKDDTGLDIKIFDENIKNQYQLTTQKSETSKEKAAFDSKLDADIKKAATNHSEHGYADQLYFFYSRPLTNKVIREYEKKAALQGIKLILIDANRIAEEAEDYLQLQISIVETNKVQSLINSDKVFPDAEKNLVFDLVGFGQTSDFKMQIIESFVLQEILSKEKLSFEEVVACCTNKFRSGENEVFYKKMTSKLLTSKRITKNDAGEFILTSDEKRRIESLKQNFDLQEQQFIKGINHILQKYNQHVHTEDYIQQLKSIYIQNFNSDIVKLIDTLATNDLTGLSRDFLNFIKKHYDQSDPEIKTLARELFVFCQKDTFLQKFCAGKVFGEASNIAKIEHYVNTQKRVFIDTQIALFGLCYYYDPKSEYEHYFFISTKSLIKFCKQHKIELNLPDRYLWETQNHLRDAFNLMPFTNLPNFEKLGKSRNVFYNYYLHIKKNREVKSFESFLGEFGFKQYDGYKKHNALIEKHLNEIGIKVCSIDANFYEIEETVKLIQFNLISNKKNKTKFGLHNDAIVMDYLSHKDSTIHPLQPIFLSWDKTFYNIQKEYFRTNPTCQRWFLMTPGRYIDQYSLLRFTLDSEVVSSEMIAVLSDDIVQSTHALIDSISFILSDTEIGLQYANKLGDIRDNEIHRIQIQNVTPPEDMEGEAVIDDIFFKLTHHYQESEVALNKFKSIFNDANLFDIIIAAILKVIENVYQTKKYDNEAIFKAFDSIIRSREKNTET